MRAITIFRRYRGAQEELDRLGTSIRQKRAILDGMGSPLGKDGVGGGSGDRDRIGRILADVDLLERKRDDRQMEQTVEAAACSVMLDWVPDLESNVLYWYYVGRMSTGEVARKLNYAPNYVRKRKRSGEQLLDMLTPERVESALPKWYLERRPDKGKE